MMPFLVSKRKVLGEVLSEAVLVTEVMKVEG